MLKKFIAANLKIFATPLCGAFKRLYIFLFRKTSPRLASRRAFCGLLLLAPIGANLAENPPVRPPGSRPEPDFLKFCLRCGACISACPTGALQPIGLEAGFSGIMSPVLNPHVGACEPNCAACGTICPTTAIFALPLSEKQQAKIGTAIINKDTCLAWARGKRCMVCKENCPYNAIYLTQLQGNISAPVVDAKKCFGCGYCENACPEKPAAINVDSKGALRLNKPEFSLAAQEAGLEIDPHQQKDYGQEAGPPPGFLE